MKRKTQGGIEEFESEKREREGKWERKCESWSLRLIFDKENEAWARAIGRKGSGSDCRLLPSTVPYWAGPLTLNRPKLINDFSMY
ncbi:hypothetical protein Csa_005231 [Cucumis sativus]|uniref:Uncharacterized protein n=1 Tax=Cucumis sativus TaxID=3659 RepID=A0A0A0KDB5_CUCSA|nr:hypothetical protein Csa_005231 [Cucumis sativus]